MYSVYVVQLAVRVRDVSRFARENPKRGKACLYVGATGIAVKQRFRNHKRGYKASRIVRAYGVRLRPSLAPREGSFYTWNEAAAAEVRLARALRKKGFEVWQR